MKEQLERLILDWDGKRTAPLAQAFATFGNGPEFVAALLELSEADADLQKGATWLLKHHLENGGTLSAEQRQALLRLLPHLLHWETRLHLLQLLPDLKLQGEEVAAAETFVRRNLNDPNTFVRAWALYGLAVLVLHDPSLKEEAVRLNQHVFETEKGAVKVRARKALELLQKK